MRSCADCFDFIACKCSCRSCCAINEGMLSKNMSEEALVAHRIVYDGAVNSGGLENVKVDKEMMKYVDKAHSQYLHHLKASKENQTIAEKRS